MEVKGRISKWVAAASAALFLAATPSVPLAIDPNTEFFLRDSLGHFWVMHLYVTTQGHFISWGHVHRADIDEGDPAWTSYFTGSGTLYPVGHPKENFADFALVVPSTFFAPPGTVSISVRGSVANVPIVYTGEIMYGGHITEPYTMTVLPDGSEHP